MGTSEQTVPTDIQKAIETLLILNSRGDLRVSTTENVFIVERKKVGHRRADLVTLTVSSGEGDASSHCSVDVEFPVSTPGLKGYAHIAGDYWRERTGRNPQYQ